MDAAEILKTVASEVAVCQKCVLYNSRKLAVPGEGPTDAEIMFIGEGPGFYENEAGRPFVGNAGKYLDELLKMAGVSRAQVYITNVIKCRPPGNRDPQVEELQACGGYLERQIEAINPRMIITLGRFSMARYLPDAKISRVHGQAIWVRERLVVPMYHPAAALHQPSLKADVEKDFARLPDYLRMIQQKEAGRQKAGQETAPAQSHMEASSPLSSQAQQLELTADLTEKPLQGTLPPAEKPEDKDKDKPVQLSLF